MLTDQEVEDAPNTGKPYKIYDGKGLHVFVSHRGSKFWRLKYRIGGKERLLSIGSTSLFTVEEARDKAASTKKLLAEGIDPAVMKREIQAARADSAIDESKGPAYKLTEKDKALADYIVDQMAARFGLTAGPF